MKRKERLFGQLVMVVFIIAAFQLLHADGFIVIPRPPHPHPVPAFPLEVKYHRVQASILDLLATTTVEQEFFNPNPYRLEGYYLFPVPTGAVIKKFSMWIDGKETEAELLDAGKARSIYEDIVRRMRDPALLEYDGRGVFKVRIFPIEPHSFKKIKISYQEIVSRDEQRFEYLYPLNTEKFSAKPLEDVSIRVDVRTATPLKTIYCPTHQVEIVRHGAGQAMVAFEGRNIKPDTDFRLIVSTDKNPVGLSLLSYQKHAEEGYFFLDINPGFTEKNQKIADKDIAFVLDVSGSMAGDNLKQAKQALAFCIENLNAGDRFEVIRFSTEAEALFSRLAEVSASSRNKAREFVKSLKAIGGTNIEEALKMALSLKKDDHRPFMVVFITDGKPTIGETEEERLVKTVEAANAAHTRIFTFGIGHDINTHLLDKITEVTRAYRTYIAPNEDIEVKISSFYTKVQSPVLTDLKLQFGDNVKVSKIYPHPLPDLFKGSSLTVFGRYRGAGDVQLTLSGMLGDQKKEYTMHAGLLKDNDKNDFIPPLWASRRIGYLLDQVRLHGQSAEVIEEIVGLARDFGIVTPYTSYLILEDEQRRVQSRSLNERDQTLGNLDRVREQFADKRRMEEESMKKKSGEGSVQASKELQELNVAASMPQMRQGESRLAYRDQSGQVQNLTQQVKNIQGRAVYQFGRQWIDSAVQKVKNQQVRRIRFASDEYFDLLKKEAQAAQFLALGNNVRFALNGQVYEVFE